MRLNCAQPRPSTFVINGALDPWEDGLWKQRHHPKLSLQEWRLTLLQKKPKHHDRPTCQILVKVRILPNSPESYWQIDLIGPRIPTRWPHQNPTACDTSFRFGSVIWVFPLSCLIEVLQYHTFSHICLDYLNTLHLIIPQICSKNYIVGDQVIDTYSPCSRTTPCCTGGKGESTC